MSMNNQKLRFKWNVVLVALCITAAGVSSAARAESIIKLTLGAGETSNIDFANGAFSLRNDGQSSTPGDHNASVDCLICDNELSAFGNPTGNGSFTLNGIDAAGSPFNNTQFIMQAFDLGVLKVYGEYDELLLSAELTKSGIQGALGANKQGLFLGFGKITGGSLADRDLYHLDRDSLQLRMKFPKILGNGFSVSSPPSSELQDFVTWTSSVEIMATIVPEPSVGFLLVSAALSCVAARRRRR